jgi:hypothetical protein
MPETLPEATESDVHAGQSNIVCAGGIIADTTLTPGHAYPADIWNNVTGGFEPYILGSNGVQWPQDEVDTYDNFGTELGLIQGSDVRRKLIKVAKGGTSLVRADQWGVDRTDPLNPVNGPLRATLLAAIAASGLPVDHFHWGVNEADRNSTVAQLAVYADNLESLLDAIQPASWSWQILSHKADGTSQLLTERYLDMQFPTADSLGGRLIETRDLAKRPNDPVHYNAQSVITIGKRVKAAKAATSTTWVQPGRNDYP